MTESQTPPTPTELLGYEGPQPLPPMELDKNARTWAMLCHFATFAGSVIPFGHIIGPLVIWQMKKSESPFIDDQGKEAVNFNISFTIYLIVAALMIMILIGIVLAPAIAIAGVVLAIIAGLKANEGVPYRYPFIIRFIK